MADGLFILVICLLPCTANSRCGLTLTVNVPDTNTRSFRRINITDATRLGAVCNDRSQGIYYISKTTDRKKWIIYLEGGVGCGNLKECNLRYEERPELMMSPRYPETIQGRDIFDPDPTINPDYWDYNMVLIPYCTSDLWIGNSEWDPAQGNEEFRFNSSATYNQFVFRGLAVFRTVVRELLGEGLERSDDVVLVGSSAGGVGAMNQAGWLRSQLSGNTTFSAILDSAWFINFEGNLVEKFDIHYVQQSMNFFSHHPCRDIKSVGYPCCVSAPCMLSKAPRNTLDFPDIPVFVIFSQYDLFMLSKSLKKLENETDDVKHLESFRTITKYGVIMKVRLNDTSKRATNLSYFVPSCLQHVYLATSDLREVGGFLRTDENSSSHDIEFSSDTKYFRSAIEPGIWSKTYITKVNSDSKVSLQCAIHEWNQRLRKRSSLDAYPVRYSDNCFGARCNPQCPESVLLGILGELWPVTAKWIVVAAILAVTVVCLLFKIIMIWKKRVLFKDYGEFINRSRVKVNDSMSLCLTEEPIGVACLDLKYSVRLSRDAIDRAREEEERRLAAEEEARNLFGYHPVGETKTEKLNHPTKKGAMFDLLGASAWTRVAGARTDGNKALQEDAEMGGLRSKKGESPSSSFDDHAGAIQREDSNESLQEKTILNGISSYFNPGQMVAIMGPSGSGKTTFLDLMTGRRREGRQAGEVLINGSPFECLREWYVKHSGYVLQLAVPYYEELTVRQNLLLAAFMRLPKSFSVQKRFERVECVIQQIGLTIVEDTVVGGSTGPGLSGGQKRRLAVAIQLLGLPRILFLDEPTSGLDATSSMELLQHLQCIAMSGRLVVLTIHQPRLEIFHMFDRILLLCQGEVAYYGSPTEAPALFLKAYQVAKVGGDAPVLDHKKNPADLIMDMLGSESYRRAIMDYYKMTFKPKALKHAIRVSKRQLSIEEMDADNEKADSGWMNRFLVLETRAYLRTNFQQSIYLPGIFLIFSLVAGLAYLQADSMLLIMASLSIYSYASSIFMFPPVYSHLGKALEIYRLERADGIGKSVEILLQTFMRYVAISALPLVICSVILCLLILSPSFWSIERFFDIALFTLALNQTWTSIAIMIVSIFPVYGHKISPLVSCAAGFAGGFFIPPSRMKVYFGWLLYINPSYYGYAGMLRVVLPSIETGCNYQSAIECYPDTGEYWIEDFGMQDVQPYLSLLVLLIMTVVAFLVAWAAIEIRYAGLDLGALRRLLLSQSAYARVGNEDECDGCSESDSMSESDNEAKVPRASVPSIAINEPLQVANYDSVYGNENSDKEPAVLDRRQSKYGPRRSRKTSRKSNFAEETHNVFCASNPLPSAENSGSESTATTLDGVRVRVARETTRRRDRMKSSIRVFTQMQNALDEDDENLEAMNHDVPLRKIQRRITMRRRLLSDASERKWSLQVPTIGEEQVTVTTSAEDVLGAYETAL